jgi:pimeloyl-ACP methyl ester carboxylesterase
MTAIFRVYQDGRFPQKVCPCVILVHSQGGNFRFNAALKAPDKVKALIAIEPSGAPNVAQADVAKSKDVPSDRVGRLHVESCGAATPHGRPGVRGDDSNALARTRVAESNFRHRR